MISSAVMDTLKQWVGEENIHPNEPMAAHTTFRVGGPADCLIEVENEQQLSKLKRYLGIVGIPFIVMGNGSNLLVSDRGYRGIVLQIGKKMNAVRVEGGTITAQGGAQLSQVSKAALENGLTGFEFASGIPGTIGGGVVMNAGAYGGEMSQVVTAVTVVDADGEVLVLDRDSMEFGYRSSVIRHQPFTVVEVTLQLTSGDPAAIRACMDDLAVKRRSKQPLEYPSAGSTFKRPEGYYAGELIMNAGMRGFRIGGACVSEKHCGFVINTGNASAQDIMEVIREVQERVSNCFHVWLEPEVVFLGDFESAAE